MSVYSEAQIFLKDGRGYNNKSSSWNQQGVQTSSSCVPPFGALLGFRPKWYTNAVITQCSANESQHYYLTGRGRTGWQGANTQLRAKMLFILKVAGGGR
jgi:hypothetical protein